MNNQNNSNRSGQSESSTTGRTNGHDVSETSQIKIHDLSRWYGPYPGLQKLDLEIYKGDTLGIIGPNGSGKTTLLRLLAGQLRPTTGTIYADDTPISRNQNFVRNVGYAGHNPMLYEELTPVENLSFFAGLYDCKDTEDRIESLLKEMELWTRRDTKVKSFSRGMKKRLALCRALIHSPSILLLDEPFHSLDQNVKSLIFEKLREFTGSRGTLVLASHQLKWIHKLCRRALMLVNSKPLWCRRISDREFDSFQNLYTKGTEENGSY